MTEPLSNAESQFILNSFAANERVDGRRCDAFREVRLWVGQDYGSALVFVGATKILAQVSYEIVEPRSGRPNIGNIEINVNMSPMANPTFEEGRLGRKGLEISRLLESTIRESGCVDLEALCLRANIEVFQLNVDITILNDDGSLPDACSIAAITALCHFRRPDCTVLTDRTIINKEFNRAFVPLNIFHMPILITFGLIDNQSSVVVDCTEREELCLDGSLFIAVNKRREVVTLQQGSSICVKKHLILNCVSEAMARASNVTDLIVTVLNDDKKKRAKREKIAGFTTVGDMGISNSCTVCEADVLLAPGVNTQFAMEEALQQLDKSRVQTEGKLALIGYGASEVFPEGEEVEGRNKANDDETMESDLEMDLENDLNDILEATKPKSSQDPAAMEIDSEEPTAIIPSGSANTPVKPLNPNNTIVIESSSSDDDCQVIDVKLALKKKPVKGKGKK